MADQALQDLSREMTLDMLRAWRDVNELAGILFERMDAESQHLIRRFPDNWALIAPALATMNPTTREMGLALLCTLIADLEVMSYPSGRLDAKTESRSGVVADLDDRVTQLEGRMGRLESKVDEMLTILRGAAGVLAATPPPSTTASGSEEHDAA